MDSAMDLVSLFGLYYMTAYLLDDSDSNHSQKAPLSIADTDLLRIFISADVETIIAKIVSNGIGDNAPVQIGTLMNFDEPQKNEIRQWFDTLILAIIMHVNKLQEDRQEQTGGYQGEYNLFEQAKQRWVTIKSKYFDADAFYVVAFEVGGSLKMKIPVQNPDQHILQRDREKIYMAVLKSGQNQNQPNQYYYTKPYYSIKQIITLAAKEIEETAIWTMTPSGQNNTFGEIDSQGMYVVQEAYSQYLKEKNVFAQEMGQLNQVDMEDFTKFALNKSMPLDDNNPGDPLASATMLNDDLHGSTRAIERTKIDFDTPHGLYDNDENANATSDLLSAFMQRDNGGDVNPDGQRDTVRGNLYDMHPMGAETTNSGTYALYGADTFTSLLSNFSIKETKQERLNDSHFDDSDQLVGMGAQSVRTYQDELVANTYQNLQRHDEKPSFYNPETGRYDDSNLPVKDAGTLTSSDRFILDPAETHPQVDSDGYVKPTISNDMGRADRQAFSTYQPPSGTMSVDVVPLRSEYVETSTQSMLPTDSYHNAIPQRASVPDNPKINAHVEYYAGQQTGDYNTFNHTNEIILDAPKKSELYSGYEHASWGTGPQQSQSRHLNGPESVKASLRSEYVEYNNAANNGALINSQHGRNIQTDSATHGVNNNQNIRSGYEENNRLCAKDGADFVPQRADLLTEVDLPKRNIPDMEKDVDSDLLEPLTYNPLVP